MSAVGQTCRSRDVCRMSDLPQTADIYGPGRHFAFGPLADIAPTGAELERGYLCRNAPFHCRGGRRGVASVPRR
jgi:hypothetical protein